MSQECLRTGDKALIRFRFIKYPEYMVPGQRMVFREGRTKAVGNVVRIFTQISNAQIGNRMKQPKNPQRFPQNVRSQQSNGQDSSKADDSNNMESSSEKHDNAVKIMSNNKKSKGKRGGKSKSNQLGNGNKPLMDVANITALNAPNRTAAKVQ